MSGAGRAPLRLGEVAAPLALLAVLAAGWVSTLVVWAAAALAGSAGAVPDLGAATFAALVEATERSSLDPLIGSAGSRVGFWAAAGALAAPPIAAAVWVTWWITARQARFGTAEGSMARRRDVTDMYGRGAERRAVQLRPSLSKAAAARRLDRRDLGVRLGVLDGEQVVASEEDVLLEIAGPRSNKTSALVVPAVITAPGPMIAASNKPDVFVLASGLRAQVGRVFTFDPQRIVGAVQDWWMDPFAAVTNTEEALRVVIHFSQTIGSGHERADPYFTSGAERLMAQHVLAAARSGRTFRDVMEWLAIRSDEPVALLHQAGFPSVARALQGTLEAPGEQRGGLYETALTALRCLESEAVLRYITPPSTWRDRPQVNPVEKLDPWRFLVGYTTDERGEPIPRDTLFMLTEEGPGSGAPVIALIVDQLFETIKKAARPMPNGRLNPPVRIVLDEAGNICKIQTLPSIFSYAGGISAQVMAFLQSYQQGVGVWGRSGMDALWSAATIKLVGAGVHDPSFCENVSRLIGPHDVPTWSDQRGRGGGSTTLSTRRDQIMSAADVGALEKTAAILISTGRKPGKLRLLPWYTEHDAEEIQTYGAEALRAVQDAAIAALGPDNPLVQRLLAERQRREQGKDDR